MKREGEGEREAGGRKPNGDTLVVVVEKETSFVQGTGLINKNHASQCGGRGVNVVENNQLNRAKQTTHK